MYNRDGSLASETYPSGRIVSHTYNRLGQSATLTSGGSTLVSSVSYHGHGGINALVMGNGLTEQTCYNTRLQPTIRRLGTGTQTGCANGGDKLHLTFDWGAAGANNGNLKGQTIAAPGFSQTQYYEYDATNRLKIAVEGAPVPGSLTCPATSSWCREYNFDHFGNRWVSSNRTMHMAVPTSQSAFNAANNRLAAGGYDAAGNMTSHPYITPGGSMAYNANNLMTSFTSTGVSVQTAYDTEGRRVRKIKETEVTLWVYDASGRLAAEYRNGSGPGFAASTPEREYSYGLVSVVHEGTNRYYRTTDHLGSTRIVTDQTGAVKQRRDFFPFGEEIPADSSHGGRNAVLDGGVATYNALLGLRQQFTGQERDSETGLDYFGFRYYFGPLGRFITPDPSSNEWSLTDPRSWNDYAYVRNNCLNAIDRDGLQSCGSLKAFGDGRTLGELVNNASDRAYLAQMVWGESQGDPRSAGYLDDKRGIAMTAINRYRIANGIVTAVGADGVPVDPGYFGGLGTTLTQILLAPGQYHAFGPIASAQGPLQVLRNRERFDRILATDISVGPRLYSVTNPVTNETYGVNEECYNLMTSYIAANLAMDSALDDPFEDLGLVTHFNRGGSLDNPDPGRLTTYGRVAQGAAHTFFGFSRAAPGTFIKAPPRSRTGAIIQRRTPVFTR